MKKRMIKLMTIFCMAGILTVNPVIIGLAEEADAVEADVQKTAEPGEEPAAEEVVEELEAEAEVQGQNENDVADRDATVNYVKLVTFDYNNDIDPSTKHSYEHAYVSGASINMQDIINDRAGYDFVGWYKDGVLLTENKYTITDTDVQNESITFTAGWRQKVTVTVDGTENQLQMPTATAADQVTYSLLTPNNLPNYVFANKWIINGEGTPFDSKGSMTVQFAQRDGNHLYDVSRVSVNGTDFVETPNSISLTSCWDTVDGQYNLRIENKTTGILTANQKEAAVNEIIDIEHVSDKDDIEFKKGNWTLKKPVSDLANRSIKYVNKDGKYYQYRESTITDQDFEKKVNYTYEDDFTDTKFSNIGTGTASIHPGVKGQTWASILPKDASAVRGNFTFAGWNYLLNGAKISETNEIDFYDNGAHSLIVKPIWEGTYSYNGNAPADETVTVPKGGSKIVNTNIKLPQLNDISGRYTFAGWLGSDNKTYQAGETYRITEANVTFTAQWKAVPYDLKFVDKDGKVYSEGKADYNTQITWPSKPMKEGYTFRNWIVELDKNEWDEVEHGSEFPMRDQDITFIAQWSINSYKISYDGNGAAMGVPAETVEQNYQTDYTIDRVVPTKTGYTFQGWSDGTTTYQPGAVFKVPARDVVLTAQWKANSHQVKYDGNGGKTSAPESKSADYNSNVSVAAGLEKDGYLFEGWEQISTGKVLTPGASFVMPDMDETLKAKWKIAYTGIYEAGVYYLIQGQSYILGPGRKAQGDSSTYTANVTIYVPQSGYYTFE
jgi:uncharacterized repeat protein (TIGR02543 family)